MTTPCRDHLWDRWVMFHHAPTGPEPAHTSFVVLTCPCGAMAFFPPENYQLCTAEFKEQLRTVAAAAGWREEPT